MARHLSTSGIIGTIIMVALITPMFALACTRGVSAPSAFNDLKASFMRFR